MINGASLMFCVISVNTSLMCNVDYQYTEPRTLTCTISQSPKKEIPALLPKMTFMSFVFNTSTISQIQPFVKTFRYSEQFYFYFVTTSNRRIPKGISSDYKNTIFKSHGSKSIKLWAMINLLNVGFEGFYCVYNF